MTNWAAGEKMHEFGVYRTIMHLAFSIFTIISVILFGFNIPAAATEDDLIWSVPKVSLAGQATEIKVTGLPEVLANTTLVLRSESLSFETIVQEGVAVFSDVKLARSTKELTLVSIDGSVLGTHKARVISGWLSILPALIAIAVALMFHQVIPALFFSIWFGATLVYGWSIGAIWHGLLDLAPVYVLSALNDSGHISIVIFSLMIGGLVGIISKNGGMAGIVHLVSHWATSPKRGQIATAGLGMAVFFDDYANTMIAGNTMRPITDKLNVSREKLSYLVDSTAAPIASIALVTTWVGFEVGLIDESLKNIPEITETAYSIFLNSIPYAFYSILALIFVFIIAASQRDFGPMLRAERRARSTGAVSRMQDDEATSPLGDGIDALGSSTSQRAANAVVPLLILIFGTILGIYYTGSAASNSDASLRTIIGNGDPYVAMMSSSLCAVVVATLMTLVQKIMALDAVIDAWLSGVRSMVMAIVLLTLAWALSNVNGVLHTADFLAGTLGDTLPPAILPALVFILAAATAFATGTSWGVMGIMIPLVIPLTWVILSGHGLIDTPQGNAILYSAVASLLSGAVWGDHCSPVSDTTILSSMASQCDHMDHVHTQIPYALAVGLVALTIGIIPSGFGVAWWISLILGIVLLWGALRIFGKPTENVSKTWQDESPISAPSQETG